MNKQKPPASSCQLPGNRESFRKLVVWKKAKALVVEVYRVTTDFPVAEKFSLTAQMRRSALSIPANIAEGKERQYAKEFAQFLYIAKGSLAELEVFIELSLELNFLGSDVAASLLVRTSEVGRLLNGLLKVVRPNDLYLRESPGAGSWELDASGGTPFV